MESVTYGPNELKGRVLKEDGDGYTWIHAIVDNKNMYCKADQANFEAASQGNPFMAYNPWMRNVDGSFIYLPSVLMVIEPFFVSRASLVAFVHHQVASDLDKMSREAFSGIVLAKENDVPKNPPKLIKV
jgi:hypothetical protein